jgi:hypothetical protein
MVRLLSRGFQLSLRDAARIADRAMQMSPEVEEARVALADDGSAAIVVDLARYYSVFTATLATALHNGEPKAPGRPALTAQRSANRILTSAKAAGVDLSLLAAGLERTPAERLRRLDDNTAFIRAMRPARSKAVRQRPLVSILGAEAGRLPSIASVLPPASRSDEKRARTTRDKRAS